MLARSGLGGAEAAVCPGGGLAWLGGNAGGGAWANVTRRKPLLVAANPAIQLFDTTGACTAYASCWRVDWSPQGTGTAIVLWQPDGVTVHSADQALGAWLADRFVRHFPELNGLSWHLPRPRSHIAHIEVSLAVGMHARAGDLEVSVEGVLDRRTFATDTFSLGGIDHSLSLVLAPCDSGGITLGGRALPGVIRLSGTAQRPSSSAFVTEAEVWEA